MVFMPSPCTHTPCIANLERQLLWLQSWMEISAIQSLQVSILDLIGLIIMHFTFREMYVFVYCVW